jgi:hypothetical protein
LNYLNLGGVSLEEGKVDEAEDLYRRALAIFKELGHTFACACALDGLAAVALEHGEPALAARFGGAAEALHETVGTPLEPYEQRLRDRNASTLRATLEPGDLEREWARGRAMTFEEHVSSTGSGSDRLIPERWRRGGAPPHTGGPPPGPARPLGETAVATAPGTVRLAIFLGGFLSAFRFRG